MGTESLLLFCCLLSLSCIELHHESQLSANEQRELGCWDCLEVNLVETDTSLPMAGSPNGFVTRACVTAPTRCASSPAQSSCQGLQNNAYFAVFLLIMNFLFAERKKGDRVRLGALGKKKSALFVSFKMPLLKLKGSPPPPFWWCLASSALIS